MRAHTHAYRMGFQAALDVARKAGSREAIVTVMESTLDAMDEAVRIADERGARQDEAIGESLNQARRQDERGRRRRRTG